MSTSHCSERSNIGAGGVTSTIAGPYKILLSARDAFVDIFVIKTYVWPIAVAGITAVIIPPAIVGTTDVVLRPLQNVTKNVDGSVPLTLKVKAMPSAAGIPWVAVRVGKAMTGRAALVLGQDLMKAAARV